MSEKILLKLKNEDEDVLIDVWTIVMALSDGDGRLTVKTSIGDTLVGKYAGSCAGAQGISKFFTDVRNKPNRGGIPMTEPEDNSPQNEEEQLERDLDIQEGWLNVNSSMIKSMKYKPQAEELLVEFNNQWLYKYENVTKDVFIQIITSPSKGKAFNKLIKQNEERFPYKQLIQL